jgi:hypothetical protein
LKVTKTAANDPVIAATTRSTRSRWITSGRRISRLHGE